MAFSDILFINNWKNRRFIIFVISIQLVLIGLIIFKSYNFDIPIIRQVIGFIYLTFIPGFIILRILNIKNIEFIKNLLYPVGLSLIFIMFVGLFINSVYPYLGIKQPLSLISVLITIISINSILAIFVYIRDKKISDTDLRDNLTESINSFRLSFTNIIIFLIPFLAIFSAYLVNIYSNYILMFILVFILSLIPIITIIFGWPKEKYYPQLILSISLSLLLHWTLISSHITGGDIHFEYYFSSIVLNNHYWTSDISNNLNAMLSLVMLAPIYSEILNLNLNWVLKLIYPVLFSLVPLGLYSIFRKQTDNKIAFLAVFYFMAVFPFFSEMLQLARQEIAEVFLVLLILVLLDKKIKGLNRSILAIIFSLAIVVSHYGITYIILLILIFSLLILFLANKYKFLKFNRITLLNSTFITLFAVFALAWYIYVSNSNAFISIVNIGNHITSSLLEDIFDPNSLQSLAMLSHQYEASHQITKYLYIFSQALIPIGILKILYKQDYTKFTNVYKALSISCIIILVISLVIPNFASSLNTTRIYHIVLIFLAPFTVIGIITIFQLTGTIFKNKRLKFNIEIPMKTFSIFLTIFLLFTSGLVYELVNDEPISIALSKNYDFPKYNDLEVSSAHWFTNHGNLNNLTLTDTFGKYLLNEYTASNIIMYDRTETHFVYLYLRTINVENGTIINIKREGSLAVTEYLNLTDVTKGLDKIYSNGGSDIYFK